MTKHTVRSFDDDLDEIGRLIHAMGSLAADMVAQSTGPLTQADRVAVAEIRREDRRMDDMQREVDNLAVTTIALRQPMAQDLRIIVSAIRTAGEYERIGDLAKNISRRLEAVGSFPAMRHFAGGLDRMSQLTCDQAKAIVALYAARSPDRLDALRDRDEAVDTAYLAVFGEVLAFMKENPADTAECTHLLFCAKNLERIGDHVTNIAEHAYYMETGEELSAKRPKRNEFMP